MAAQLHKPAIVMLLQRQPGHNGAVSADCRTWHVYRLYSIVRNDGDAARKGPWQSLYRILSRRDDDRHGPTERAPINAGTDKAKFLYLAVGEPVRNMFSAVRIRPQVRRDRYVRARGERRCGFVPSVPGDVSAYPVLPARRVRRRADATGCRRPGA